MMPFRFLFAGSLTLAFTAVVAAQGGSMAATKSAGGMTLSGSMDCPNAPPAGMVEAGDTPGHAFVLIKAKCTWTKGEIAGVKVATEEDAGVAEMTSPTASKDFGVGVASLANGDKVYVRFQGSGTYKAGTPPTPTAASGTWSFTGGTGKAKGIAGKGTYKGTFKPDGAVTWQIDGTYSAAAPAK
jgi:hypothetical protein